MLNKIKLGLVALLLPLLAFGQSYPSPTFNNLTVQGTLSVTGAPTFTLPVPVGSGGTGAATLTSHGVVLGQGTSAVHITSAGTSGQPLLSGGASADPNWGALSVPFGGTGLASVTQYNVAVGGSSAFAFVGPTATSGIPLVSQGSAAYPAFSTAVPAGGGTGLTTITAHGVMLGEGTGNVATAGPDATTGKPLVSQGSSSDPAFSTSVTGLTFTSAITPQSTGGIVGTTAADNANAGSIGEVITATNSSGISLTNNVSANVTSISLTAGDWEVSGIAIISSGGGGSMTNNATSISTTSAALGPLGTYSQLVTTGLGSGGTYGMPTPTVRINVSSPTTVYLVTYAGFSSGTASATGVIKAIRTR